MAPRILTLPAASTATTRAPQTELPSAGISGPYGAAVDAASNVYVADILTNRVDGRSTTATPDAGAQVCPRPGARLRQTTPTAAPAGCPIQCSTAGLPRGALSATRQAGAVATLDHHTTARPGPRQGLRWGLQGHRKAGAATAKSSARLFRRPNRRTTIALTASAVVILAVIALAIPTMAHQDSHPSQTMPPFPGLDDPWGVTVDYAGNLYVSDSNNLTADSSTTTEVPFTGLNNPAGVAMSGTGTLYVVDGGNNNGRVLQLTGGER